MRKVSEDQLIASLARVIERASVKPKGLTLGPGDDAAIVRGPGLEDYVVTEDVLVEGRHFETRWFKGRELGWRLAAVNLSDVAAMNAMPRFAMISLVVPAGIADRYVREIERGVVAHLARYGAAVIGGNISSTDGPLTLNLTLIGVCDRGKAWRRRARAGDAIVLVGDVGRAAAGLSLLKQRRLGFPGLVAAYKKPIPLLAVTRALHNDKAITGAMDISDGLSTDLIRMCRKNQLGCDIETPPVRRDLGMFLKKFKKDPVEWTLAGGEDYGLLLSVRPRDVNRICARIRARGGASVATLGHFTRIPESYRLIGQSGKPKKFSATGWDHLQ